MSPRGDDTIDLYEIPSGASVTSGRQATEPDYNPIHDPHAPLQDKHGTSRNLHAHRHHSAESSHHDHVIHAGDERAAVDPTHRSHISSHLPEDIAKERERLDLFVDLIWVGIIGNLSDVFSSLAFRAENPDSALGMLVFILVFLPSWRIWDAMREFLNNYYMDDMVQRAFTFWILVLSVFYGNQLAYLTEDIDAVKTWCISVYLVILGSFLAIEWTYSIWIVWLRKLVFFQWLIRMPSVALWVVATNLKGSRAIGPIVGAIVWEYLCPALLDSTLTEKLTPMEYRKALDVHHFQSRLSNFFIIILGEGVLQLVKGGPLGRGLHDTVGVMSWVLLIYYEFSFLYFNRDGSQKFIPAVTHRGFKTLAWVFWHIPLFASILTFTAGVMFILRSQSAGETSSTSSEAGEGGQISEEELPRYVHRAVWTCASSVSAVMFSLTIIALMDKSLDEPGTLKIDNRYIRLSMRIVFMVATLCIPLAHVSSQLFLGMVAMMLFVVGVWEWNVSLDRGGALIEPKGLSLMLSRELKT
ncbi:hypothetical protein H2200_004715 [Cladophialophora chaetospira]|uniref:Low temperature requirement A n=1 Tax=Cladophialophora chaetospira TaxID=386627 RepID=A0AA38XDL9_9EURO|nr:hypothetical protein H2200_004715 [Cladophialophora chaetospira]